VHKEGIGAWRRRVCCISCIAGNDLSGDYGLISIIPASCAPRIFS
jgi:hypothetical protein